MKSPYAIAIDLGASNVRVALIDQSGKILQKVGEPTAKQGNNGIIITKQIIGLVRLVLEKNKATKVQGIGIASIGPLDYKRGGPTQSPNVPFAFIPLVKPLKKEFSTSVLLLNDANAAALGEKYFGAGKNVKNLVYITLSTGIGGGAIVEEKLLLGKSGNAAEIGHMIVDTLYNLRCTCQKGFGHWEGLASGRNIPRFFETWAKIANKNVSAIPNAKDIFQEAQRGNKEVLAFLEELAKVNAYAISNLIVAYDPELITIGGSVALNNQEIIIQGIKKYVDHYLEVPKIQITKLGDDIGLLGAAAAVFQNEKG